MVGFWLEQYRVHFYYRSDTGGLGLNNLRPAHFSAVGGHPGIQRYILRLERRGPIAILGEYSAQGSNKNALAHRGSGSLNHDKLGRHFSPRSRGSGLRYSRRQSRACQCRGGSGYEL